MSEESIETPLTAEKTETARGHETRTSTGSFDTPNSGLKILSRYLRASPSSCHDACKYGTKHVFEAKSRSSFPKMVTAKGGESQVLEKAVHSAGRKQKSAISPKPSSDSKMQKPSNLVVIKGVVSSSRKVETASLEKEINVCVENATDQKLKQSTPVSHPAEGSLSIQRNNEIRISKEAPGGSGSSRKSRKSKIVSIELRTSKMGEKKAWVPSTVYLFPKHSIKGVSSVYTKNRNNVKNVEPKQPRNEDVPEKTLYIIEESTENRTVEPSQNHVHTINLSPSPEDKTQKDARKGIRSSRSSSSFDKNNLRSAGTEFNCTQSPSSSFLSLGNKSLMHKRCGTHSARSSLSSLSSSSASLSPSEPSHCKKHGAKITGSEDQVANAKVEYKSRPRRGGIVSSEFSPARKLKFWGGKVVELQSENSTPRRLKFRRVRLLGETQNGKDDTRKSSIWRKEVDDAQLSATKFKSERDFQRCHNVGSTRRSSGRKEIGDTENGTKIKSEEVVLRHQNVEGKKDARSLFNNVIEETASKLVVTRKSKVKALVGAFETVISLLDNRPSVTTVT